MTGCSGSVEGAARVGGSKMSRGRGFLVAAMPLPSNPLAVLCQVVERGDDVGYLVRAGVVGLDVDDAPRVADPALSDCIHDSRRDAPRRGGDSEAPCRGHGGPAGSITCRTKDAVSTRSALTGRPSRGQISSVGERILDDWVLSVLERVQDVVTGLLLQDHPVGRDGGACWRCRATLHG